ncbi:DMT family transporter [Candidatus Dependentiae bacterium]|nr:MAG: DMT family transporter [Candidatus Dependentiae bacterium]
MIILWVVGLYFLSAVNLILRKMILAWSQPIFFQGMRLTIAGAVILGYLYLFRPAALRFKKADLGLFFQVALFFAYLSYLFSVITIEDLSSARFAFMFTISPFITAILAYFFLGQKLNKLEMVSLFLGFVGFLPLVLVGQQEGIASASFLSWPGLQLFISNATYAYGWILVSKLVNNRGYSPFLVTGIAFAGGGIATLCTSFLFENWLTVVPVTDLLRFSTYLLAIILISEVIVSNTYATLLRYYSVTFLAFAGTLYPLFSALLGWVFFQEKITYNFFISASIVALALYLFYLAEKRKQSLVIK